MPTTDQPEKTYVERAMTMNKQARRAHIERAVTALKKARSATDNIAELEILSLNSVRAAGLEFNLASGHEQLIFSLEGAEFCRREILPFLPEGIGLKQIQVAVQIAGLLPEPIKTREELLKVKPQVQLVLEMFGLVDAPHRKQLQTAHARNLFADFVSSTASLSVLFDKLESEAPMESWPTDKLDEFLENAQPVKQKIEKAEKLRLKTATA